MQCSANDLPPNPNSHKGDSKFTLTPEELTVPGVTIDRDEASSSSQTPRSSSAHRSSALHSIAPPSLPETAINATKPSVVSSSAATSSYATEFPVQYKNVKSRCPEIIYTLSQVKAEMYCTKCNSQSPVGRPKSQSCYLCGDDVATTQNGVSESEIKLSGLETLVYQCKKHNEFAWQRGFSRMCVSCRRPISDSFFCSFAIKCAGCSFGDSSSSARCCKIMTEEDE